MGEDHEGASHLVAAAVAQALLTGLDLDAEERSALLAECGLSEDDLDPDGWIEQEAEERLWQACLGRDPDIGVHAAMCWPRGTFRALELLVRAQDDVRSALRTLVRHHWLLHGVETFHLEPDERGRWLLYANPHPGSPIEGPSSIFALLSVDKTMRELAAVERAASVLELAHPADRSAPALHEAFGGEIHFEAGRDALLFDEVTLARRSRSADPVLADVLRAVVVRALEELSVEAAPSTAARVRAAITDILPDDPLLEIVAQRLGTSERTLQARLAEEETTFRDELDRAREKLARGYLRREELTLPGIALLLGYSDASVFHRAFRRWTGTTPARYRRSLRGPDRPRAD
ncbi:MAG TPA: AraC family transcriptional regulator ligand-binding domain-containing protein [Polyangiaceae bacterium LLY-WYZ-15_(1-7)]|nr:hypothetical protein [Myxococcales bacterium]MAT30141.1 hypothetical protein [Sandaracinus sp.]HJK95552.1 AraC family transcriptional regulator ligand-binding domain-containing protein [Polyangiaceae bacterium LLY-WYZ-15_(1-7)]MBJ73532.1 hypothetical protein [Sandaracinus sp.]HJL04775.1 AraC family transcriptional regulator ligand-binding domain-containing protein [Polyangiaceae bacterium LLY-WYZ-15_(1-7)]